MATVDESLGRAKTQGPKKSALGRGLGSLFSETTIESDKSIDLKSKPKAEDQVRAKVVSPPTETRVWSVGVEKIRPSSNQPRKEFDSNRLTELANSIKEQGIIQPLLVRKTTADNSYELIAGERRWRAAQMAGLHEVPIIIKETTDQKLLELALIENIQREDLNPIEEAVAFQELMSTYGLNQQQVAEKVGKDRVTVANTLRLLKLPSEVQTWLIAGQLTPGHAKAILMISDENKQIMAARKIVNEGISVRGAERLAKRIVDEKSLSLNTDESQGLTLDVSARLIDGIRQDLQRILGTKVEINYESGKGKIAVHFYSDEQLSQFVEYFKETWKQV